LLLEEIQSVRDSEFEEICTKEAWSASVLRIAKDSCEVVA
jgi:hypothetical protein